jgi:recombination protein RecT
VVYEGDEFAISYGSSQELRHVPTLKSVDRGGVIGAYAYAKLKSGEEQWVFMTTDEIEAVRKRSKAANNGPWVTDWNEMGKKTALKRLCKVLPLSIKDQRVLVADSAVISATKADDILDLESIDYAEEEVVSTPQPVDTSTVDIETGEVVEEAPKALAPEEKKASRAAVKATLTPEEKKAANEAAAAAEGFVEPESIVPKTASGIRTPMMEE